MALIDNLISYWKLDEASGANATDAHNVGPYNLTPTNTVGTTTGALNGARTFVGGGTGSWLSCADNANLSGGDVDFTIAGWFKWSAVGGGAQALVYKGGSNDLAYELSFTGTRARFRISSGAGFANLTTVTANSFGDLTTGVWYFIAARHSATSNTIDISINGGTVDSTSYTAGSYDEGGSFFIGHNPFSENFNGAADEVAFWKRRLSDSELDALYNGGTPLAYPLTTAQFTATPFDLPKNHSGNIVLTLSGTSTTWAGGGSEFSISGVAGVTKVSENVTSTTAATLTITTGSTAGTLTITDGDGLTTTVSVTTATLAALPNVVQKSKTSTVTLTGGHTLWSTETAAGLFSVSGGTGASIGTPTVTSDTTATVSLSAGSAAGNLTVTDNSTGATTTVAASAATVMVVCLGDSITAGLGVTGPEAYPAVLQTDLGSDYYVLNAGISGNQITQMDARLATDVTPYLQFDRNVVIDFGGTNDARAGQTGAGIWSRLQTLASDERAAKPGVILGVGTLLSFDDDTIRDAANTLIRANYAASFNFLVDWGSDTRFAKDGDSANTTYYQDGTHPTALTLGYMATDWAYPAVVAALAARAPTLPRVGGGLVNTGLVNGGLVA